MAKKVKRKKETTVEKLTHRLTDVLSEIVEAPPEPVVQSPVEEQPASTPTGDEETTETLPVEDSYEEEQPDERTLERLRRKQEARDEILSNLNNATARWKETGELGIKLEPPVPFRQRVKTLWQKTKPVAFKIGSAVKTASIAAASGVKTASVAAGSTMKTVGVAAGTQAMRAGTRASSAVAARLNRPKSAPAPQALSVRAPEPETPHPAKTVVQEPAPPSTPTAEEQPHPAAAAPPTAEPAPPAAAAAEKHDEHAPLPPPPVKKTEDEIKEEWNEVVDKAGDSREELEELYKELSTPDKKKENS